LPGFTLAEFTVASRGGAELYVFSVSDRHLRTLDARTKAVLYSFRYDEAGRLALVTDRDGLVTTIERVGGVPTAIVAPHGQRTTLSVDGNGYLSAIANPAGESGGYSYDANGIMETFTDPRGNVHTFHHDELGRLLLDENPAGGSKRLSRTERAKGYSVAVTTALERTTLHDVQNLGTGDQVRTLTGPDGMATTSTEYTSGTKNVVSPDGTTSSVTFGPDPQFGMQSPLVASAKVTTPSGLIRSTSQSASVVLDNPADVLSLKTRTDDFAVNGRTATVKYDAAAQSVTTTTAAARKLVTLLDTTGRVASLQLPGVPAIVFARDVSGQLRSVTQGSRLTIIDYDSAGLPSRITEPLGRLVTLQYDAAGRVVSQTLPGTRVVGFDHDPAGNVTSITPPGRPAHGFEYTAADLTARYTPPVASNTGLLGTTYSYDLDGAMAQVLLPDQSAIIPGYDAAGTLESVTTSRGTTVLGYDTAGRVSTVTAPDEGALTYSYDGPLTTSETSSGTFTGTVAWSYDNDFRVATTSVNGASVPYQYDADSLLTGAGALSISREAATGRISGTAIGSVTTTYGYNQYGELAGHGASTSGTTVYSYSLTRDLAGRITGKTETVQGVTDTYVYGYEEAGRLATVTKNGEQTASYGYDENGNRLSGTTPAWAASGAYDDQDRMTAYGAASYTYGPSGDLRTMTMGGATTTYSYDALGNLMGAWLPDGRTIEYVVDGLNRRVGKKVNGSLTEGFLYEGQLRPVAWLDGAGQVYARFVYGTRVNVPEYADPPSIAEEFLVGSPELPADERIGVYADMYLWRLTDALREDYPKLAALLGEERFRALAEAYAREIPSDRPDLGQFGRHLPAFLGRSPAQERADLADLAALEWARAEVFFEAPATPVARDSLAALAPDTFLNARLELIPALRVLALGHDAATLWRRIEDDEPADAPIADPTVVAVWRAGFEVFHGRIELDEARALEAARAGEPLASVCAAFGEREDPAAAAFAALASWFDEGWIAAISTDAVPASSASSSCAGAPGVSPGAERARRESPAPHGQLAAAGLAAHAEDVVPATP
jgi:YD repeat-containing protein